MSKYILAISISVFIVLMGIGTVLGNVMNNASIGNGTVGIGSTIGNGGILGTVDNNVYNGVDNFNLTNYKFYLPYNSYVFISAAGDISSDQLVSEGIAGLYIDGKGITGSGYDFIPGSCWDGCALPFQVQTVRYLQEGNHEIQLVAYSINSPSTFSNINIAVIYFQNGHIE